MEVIPAPYDVVCLFILVVLLIYYYLTATFDYWEKRGVKGPKPRLYFGNAKDLLFGKKCIGDFFKDIYDQYKHEGMIGMFLKREPILLLTDAVLIKDLLIKDFNTFPERNMGVSEKVEPLSVHLFRIDAARWRPLRNRLTPVFTSGKLKEMFHLLLECSEHLEKHLETLVAKGEPIECRDLTAKYTTDVIGSCAFGIEMNALNSENSEFRKMGRRIFQDSYTAFFRHIMRDMMPTLFEHLGYWLMDRELVRFFTSITMEAIEYRKNNNVLRHDFIDVLVDLKDHPEKVGQKELADTYVAAQSFVFFVAGFETSSSTMSNALYELALNPEVQKKLREEVRNVLQKNEGSITYESVKEMKYLDMFFRETLRKYPPLAYVARKAMTSYTFKNTNVTIAKGQKVFVPIYAIQRDPDIYPNPNVFDPERFNEEATKARNPMYFLPFGDGPRNCIGMRFAVNQTKVGLIKCLMKFKFDVCEKTEIPYKNHPRQLLFMQPLNGISLKVTRLSGD